MENTAEKIVGPTPVSNTRFTSMMKEAEILMQPYHVDPKAAFFTYREGPGSAFQVYACLSSKYTEAMTPHQKEIIHQINRLETGPAQESNKHGNLQLSENAIISGQVKTYFKGDDNALKKLEKALLKSVKIRLTDARWYGIPFGKSESIEGFFFIILGYEDYHKVDMDLYKKLFENINEPRSTGFYFDIPNQEEFGNMLHDRIHTFLAYNEEWHSKFMLVSNLYNRDKNRPDKHTESLVYSGTDTQRRRLETDQPLLYIRSKDQEETIRKSMNGHFQEQQNGQWRRNHQEDGWYEKSYSPTDAPSRDIRRDHNWKFLRGKELSATDKQVETYTHFKKYQLGEFKLEDIQISPLKGYFTEFNNEVQRHEFPIFAEYFDIEKDLYIGIPLLGLGAFQGIIWIVFKEEEKHRFDPEYQFVKRLIRTFQREYDNLILTWELGEENINIKTIPERLLFHIEKEPTYFESNPILSQCGVREYYLNSFIPIKQSIAKNNVIPERFDKNLRGTASITSLLDSFSHNISAHTLITLVNWFREMAEFIYGKPEEKIGLGRANNPLIKMVEMARDHGREELISLPLEQHRFLKFLLEKGAFWSGITRKTNFSGKISTFFNIFWYDFINNALYLGTIANSEQINRIKINVTIYEEEIEVEGDDFNNTKIIKRNSNGELLGGEFAVIDLNEVDIDRDMHQESEKSYSQFVQKGRAFHKLETALKEFQVFFPGGIVGKHAFFTLIENEIRNVKHYKKKDILKDMQKNGLQLNISLHLRPVDSERARREGSTKKELVKVGVWLNHSIDLDSTLITRRIEELRGDVIIEETLQPKLGGSVQDKNCAAQLLTNDFESVSDNTSPLGRIYFPWVKVATCLEGQTYKGKVQEFEVSLRNYNLYATNQFREIYDQEKGKGYLKKYFHLWKGEEVFHLRKDMNWSMEEPSRFRFIQLPALEVPHLTETLKGQKNLIRIIDHHPSVTDSLSAYPHWLPQWRKQSTPFCFEFMIESQKDCIGRLVYEDGKVSFFNKQQIKAKEAGSIIDRQSWKAKHQYSAVKLLHGKNPTNDPTYFNYRSHGRLISEYWKGSGRSLGNIRMSSLAGYELFEALITRVGIFDDRIFNRVCNKRNKGKLDSSGQDIYELQKRKLQSYCDELRLDFKAELKKGWERTQREGLLQYHFLVMHLSFIENMKSPKTGLKYEEKGIRSFIDEQILTPAGIKIEETPDNFNLIITTGRGRREWWDLIKDTPYARFTSFRNIEAINAAIGDAIEVSDDLDMKINLTKILFGS